MSGESGVDPGGHLPEHGAREHGAFAPCEEGEAE